MLKLAAVLLLSVSIAPAQAYEKKCGFVDDDGACNDLASVAEIQRVKKGTSYAELRKRMLAIGYVARPAGTDPSRCEPELSRYCQSYPETIACKSVGGADCQFVLYTNGVAFVVKTIGNGSTQRVKSVHHLTIQDQQDLEASFVIEEPKRGAKQNFQSELEDSIVRSGLSRGAKQKSRSSGLER